VTGLDPALIRIDKARLHNARLHDAPRLGRALDQLTPASIGLNPRATLIVRRLALRTPLSRAGPADRFVADLRDDLRARLVAARRGSARDDEDLIFDDDAELETAIVAAWLDAGSRETWIHAIGVGAPITRWRRHILPDLQLLPRVVARLVERGDAERWLAHFEVAELKAVAARLLENHGAPHHATDLWHAATEPESESPASKPDHPNAYIEIVSAIAPEACPIARTDICILIAVALAIVRRPTVIATPAFIESLKKFAARPATSRDGGQNIGIAKADQILVPKSFQRASTVKQSSRRPRGQAPVLSPVAPVALAGSPPRASAYPEPPIEPEARTIATNFGGMFFLLNAFLALRLYGDFTRPGEGLKGLSPFELMHMLGTRWFGATFKVDPIAPLFITLAGLEPGEKPGRLFVPPPPSSDIPFVTKPGLNANQWIAKLAQFLAARLQQALGNPDAVAITCTQPGRILIERDRINIHFPLADHPIALRFAGLDRNPGWVPAAAHFIEFSFT
jgi:hypothetical protein